ncbi:MAG: glycosyltransferase family 2 protein [Bacteroidota bacterium]|nr:glycosyltransferase family 2 protein [Bacteroidota bacterium]
MPPFISVVVIAGEEERNISCCLESATWADEIVVVHSSRSDRTAEIAHAYTPRVMYREFDTFSAQRSYALSQVRGEWVFALDADERITDSLREEVLRTLTDPGGKAGYLVPRKNRFLGRWLRHGGWYPDFQLRLFRRDCVRVDNRLVHEGYIVDGDIGRLANPIDHDTDPDIEHHLRKNLEYTRLEAMERRKRVRPSDLVLHPAAAFLRAYLVRGGWKDGAHGLAAALIHSAYTLQQYLFMWELGLKSAEAPPGPSQD